MANKVQDFGKAIINVTQEHLDPDNEEDMKCYKAVHAVCASYSIGEVDKVWDALKGIDGELSDRINSIMN